MDILNNRLIKTELVEWKKLVPFQPDNLKKTEPHKLQKLANSLCQNGFSMNFYVWEKDGQIYIIDGHSRWEVLQLIDSGAILPKVHTDKINYPYGMEYQVTVPEKLPCSFLHLKNKTEAKKAVLIYNSKYKNIDSDILAEWVSDLNLDELKSQIEIPELKLDFDLPQELENDSIDDAAKIKTDIKVGDLIEIGRHRLLCGDSTKKEDVERLMNGEKADMVLTDPPYNGQLGGGGFKNSPNIKNGINKMQKSIEKIYDFNPMDVLNISNAYCKTPISMFFFCNKNLVPNYINFALENKKGFDLLLWHKPNFLPMGGHHYFPDTEYIIKIRDKGSLFINGLGKDVNYGTYWIIESIKGEKKEGVEHPTIKPQKILTDCLSINTKKEHLVLDFFLGSGSTMVACQTLDRICYGMELEPLYCQVIINRMRKNFPELDIKVNGTEYKES